jgi:5-methylcytosine-specific restriction endonuclease McrA
MPTEEGTPQGGVISPLLANIALHGLEEYIKQWAETWSVKTKNGNYQGKKVKRGNISLIRYADDFVVLHKDKSVIQQAKRLIEQWLHGLGLELKENKTRICHIERHIKIKGIKSPYDGDWRYWSKRRGEYPGISKRVATLMKRQKGKCTRCGLYVKDEDVVEVDHTVPKAEGGKDHYKNLQLLHRHCHHQKTAEDRQRQIDNKGQKKLKRKTKKSRKSETKQGSSVKTA